MRTLQSLTLLLAAVAAVTARADTIVVDDDGGADYTDLPPAVAAASAGDLVLVLPGSYTAFALDEGLTILGVGPVSAVDVHGTVLVDGSQATRPIVLSSFTCTALEARSCGRLLLLEELELGYITHDLETAGATALVVEDCEDVRALRTRVLGGPEKPTVLVARSRIEFVLSEVRAGGGCGYEPPIIPDPLCYPGVCVRASDSTVRFALSSAIGEDGQEHYLWDLGGEGADAFDVGSTDLLLSGRATDVIRSGSGAAEWGLCGFPLILHSSVARHSGVVLDAGWTWDGQHCDEVYGCCAEVAAPFDPTLEPLGVAVPGSALTLRLRAPREAHAWVVVGREAIVRPRAGIVEDVLTLPLRRYDLGVVPPASELDFDFSVPQGLPTGQVVFAQAVVSLPGGELRLSHSVPLLVH